MESKEGQKSTELFEISSKKKEILSPAWLHSRLETPPTPGRPLFSFRAGNPHRKSFPSKWDNAEKWLVRSSGTQPSLSPNDSHKTQVFNPLPEPNPTDTLLKDKFTCSAEKAALSVFSCSETSKGGILLKDSVSRFETRDIGTEITPICSLSASICHTPMKSSSPVRHNTPADLSGPLVAASTKFDISELNDCHFAKLELSAQYDSFAFNWSSREEEEEEVSKSLRHFELNNERKNMAESRASFWENEERAKSCIRYQREEAKIQAWVNLQTAKAEEKSRKLEVKIQKMRSSLEEKLMKRMAVVHRRAEEWRAEAQLQHSQQILKTAEDELALKMHNRASYLSHHINASCANCFPMQQ